MNSQDDNLVTVLARKMATPPMTPLSQEEMSKIFGGCFTDETHTVIVSGHHNGGHVESQDCAGGRRGGHTIGL